MKTYKDIGDLYREKFSDYTPQPPAEVWERIESATIRKNASVRGKIGLAAATVTAIAIAVYFLFDTPSISEKYIDNQDNGQLITQTLPLEEVDAEKDEVIVSQNESLAEPPKETETVAVFHQNNEIDNSPVPVLSTQNNYFVSEADNHQVAVVPTPQKVEKEPVEENIKISGKTEATPAKTLPIVVSKDTTVCENATVKLFVLNAKNVRWSTGEKKNTIFVSPSSDEQYSATFSTETQQDSTVYVNVKCIRCSELFVPNAFTPNGDGLNDVFIAQSDEEYRFFEMTIYSGDGRLVLFTSKDIKRGWDGTYKNVPQPHGAYTYFIRYQDATGKMNEKKGSFLLLLY